MGKDSLSQEEIDALLTSDDDSQESETNVLVEVLRLPIHTYGQAIANSINVRLDWELTQAYRLEEIDLFELVDQWVKIEMDNTRSDQGGLIFLLEPQLARGICSKPIDQGDDTTFTDLQLDQINETFTKALSTFNEQLSSMLDKKINMKIAKSGLIKKDDQEELLSLAGSEGVFVQIVSQLNEDVYQGFVLVPQGLASQLNYLDKKSLSGITEDSSQDPLEKEESSSVKKVRPAEFSTIQTSKVPESKGNMELLLDVPLRITVELGRSEMQLRDVLALSKGQVIQLDKLAGEPVDVYVNNKLIAKGEVVVMDENFGVKITNIITPQERMDLH